jgi:hypothetical protein
MLRTRCPFTCLEHHPEVLIATHEAGIDLTHARQGSGSIVHPNESVKLALRRGLP